MRTLLTGGAGYLGRALARALADSGRSVTVLDDLSSVNSRFDVPELHHERIRCVRATTLDPEIASLVRSHQAIVHFASVVGVEETIRNPKATIRNLEGTLRLIEALTPEHVVVFGSSADVYGLHSHVYDRPMREDDLAIYEHAGVHRWVYAKVKGLEELLITESPARSANIRFFNCFGPEMDFPHPKRLIPQMIGQILARAPLRVSGDGRQTRTLCYFSDLIDGILLTLDHLASRTAGDSTTLNLGGRETLSVLEIAHMVIRLALEIGMIDEPLAIETGASLYSREFDDSWSRIPDLSKAEELLGYSPRISVEQGLRWTLEHHRKAGDAG